MKPWTATDPKIHKEAEIKKTSSGNNSMRSSNMIEGLRSQSVITTTEDNNSFQATKGMGLATIGKLSRISTTAGTTRQTTEVLWNLGGALVVKNRVTRRTSPKKRVSRSKVSPSHPIIQTTQGVSTATRSRTTTNNQEQEVQGLITTPSRGATSGSLRRSQTTMITITMPCQ